MALQAVTVQGAGYLRASWEPGLWSTAELCEVRAELSLEDRI